MVPFTKEIVDEDKPVPMENIPLVRFIRSTTNQIRIVNIQGAWDPERSVAVIATMGITVEEALANIVMTYRNMVINMEYDRKESWARSLGEVCPTQCMYQWVYWLTKPPSEEEVPNIDWIIEVLPGNNKYYRRSDPDIK